MADITYSNRYAIGPDGIPVHEKIEWHRRDGDERAIELPGLEGKWVWGSATNLLSDVEFGTEEYWSVIFQPLKAGYINIDAAKYQVTVNGLIVAVNSQIQIDDEDAEASKQRYIDKIAKMFDDGEFGVMSKEAVMASLNITF